MVETAHSLEATGTTTRISTQQTIAIARTPTAGEAVL